ncbi:hypothetical protein BGX28_010452 [Mortierella sp. GBA30]|nr:hypothetical protein BGX28_010452 [Mortierella sp. GBA30]
MEAIEKRCEQLKTATSKMLDKILDRTRGKVVIDRVQAVVDGISVNVMEPGAIKKHVMEWFHKWHGPRPSTTPEPGSRWAEQYEPRENIKAEWYQGMMDPPSLGEFENAVKDAPKHKAPGGSGTLNELFQHQGRVGSFVLMSRIMSRHNILRGPNYSVLKGTTTKDPIHALHAVLEDARENKRELWVVFQDMRRCFDSVSCGEGGMLSLGLRRIKAPEEFIQLCENIATSKVNRVITEYGTTDDYKPECGLDQGGVECPLLWRIAYDALLCEVLESMQGYNMTDAAVLLAINAKKTVVLALNPTAPEQERTLKYGTPLEEIKPIGKKEATRILGVWVNAVGVVQPTNQLVEQDVKTVCGILRRKAVTDRQAAYIVNNVLIPRVIYKLSIQVLPKSVLERITGSYMKICKNKFQLPSTTPNSVLHHHRLGGIRALADVQAEEQISSLHGRIHDDGLIGRLTRERLIALQASTGLNEVPTARPAEVTTQKHNLISSVCRIMAERNIAFNVDLTADMGVERGSMTADQASQRWIENWETDRRAKIQEAARVLEEPVVLPPDDYVETEDSTDDNDIDDSRDDDSDDNDVAEE